MQPDEGPIEAEQAMLEAMERAIYIVQGAVEDGAAPAIVVFSPETDPHGLLRYWENVGRGWERNLAALAKREGWTYGALAIPLVMVQFGQDVHHRKPTPDLPLRMGEESVIWCLGFDIHIGYQVGRCVIGVGPDAKPVFGDIEGLMGEITLRDCPGGALFQALIEG